MSLRTGGCTLCDVLHARAPHFQIRLVARQKKPGTARLHAGHGVTHVVEITGDPAGMLDPLFALVGYRHDPVGQNAGQE